MHGRTTALLGHHTEASAGVTLADRFLYSALYHIHERDLEVLIITITGPFEEIISNLSSMHE